MIPSIYNFCIPLENYEMLLYNSRTGAVLLLEGSDANYLGEKLTAYNKTFVNTQTTDYINDELVKSEFIVPEALDEVDLIHKRYEYAKTNSPVIITIATTMNCNLSCYYCYENRSNSSLTASDIPGILRIIDIMLIKSGKKKIRIDWYGGEPLLNFEFFNNASVAIQDFCKKHNVEYSSGIISNGTINWPENVSSFVKEHRIESVQITFDGMQENHNMRRKYKKGIITDTFDDIVKLVDKLVQCVNVDIRYNVDINNICDIQPFIVFLKQKQWLQTAFPVRFYLAKISCCSKKTNFLKKNSLSDVDLNNARVQASKDVLVHDTKDHLCPVPQFSVCSALNDNFLVIGADKMLYKCILQIGSKAEAIGTIDEYPETSMKEHKDNLIWWKQHDFLKTSGCVSCAFLPLCFGGCARLRKEQEQSFMQEECSHWRENVTSILTKKCEKKPNKDLGYITTLERLVN